MWNKLTGPLLLGAIGTVGVASLVGTDWKPALNETEDGKFQAGLEAAFDDALVIREPSINLWVSLKYALLKEADSGAVVGTDKVLFSSEEYEADQGYDLRLAGNIDKILTVSDALAENGTELIIALIPDKVRVLSMYQRRPRPSMVDERYDYLLKVFDHEGIRAPDLRSSLTQLGSDAFFKRDTHWTPMGAKSVAQVLAPIVEEVTPERASFETSVLDERALTGDLLNFVPMGPFASYFGIDDEALLPFTTTKVEGGLGLFDDPTVSAALVGTSYSAIKDWNFVGFLQDESNTDIIDFSLEGQGPFKPMDLFLEAPFFVNEPAPDVVIWEIPERYMTLAAE